MTEYDETTATPPDRPTSGPTPGGPAAPPPDPFDPAGLRLSGAFAADIGVAKAMVTVPVRKPDRAWFVRVHPDDGYRLETNVIELKEEREVYLVSPSLWPHLAAESTFGPRALYTAVSRQGVVLLWPVKLPGPDGKLDDWSSSAIEAAEMARDRWVRVQANMSLGAYEVYEATGDLPGPDWPDRPLQELLKVAFKGRFIDSLDHPVLRRLRGEV